MVVDQEEIQAQLRDTLNEIGILNIYSMDDLVELNLDIQDNINEAAQRRIEKLKKDMEKIKVAMGRIDGYRRTTFAVVKDLEGVNSLIQNIRIYKERSM